MSKTAQEVDEQNIKEKLRKLEAASDASDGILGARKLRKRLKRLQRKRRGLNDRLRRAMGKKQPGAEAEKSGGS